ncbi:sodium/potassium/calcium exchanger 5-like [Epargyreus clarus]|uniref:sodium/potassium/calcium exchanger 5-like n=1 Tax=Epargyreus clarus TaxID=520877 RepID=UPI003C2CE48D
MTSLSHAAAATALLIWIHFSQTLALEDFNETTTKYLPILNSNGQVVFVSEELMAKLTEESETWHWTPWLRTRTVVEDNIMRELVRSERDSIDSFPDGLFDEDQLRKGAFILYVIFGIYSFILLAIVCNDYFIPCVEMICEDLKIPQNVAAATFMSVATSCPEFFVNVISTFLTQSDMGIGTIVGSAIFNALGVAAVGGIAAIAPIKIERNAVTRDVIIYMVNVGVLVSIVWDGQVDWYEALVLGILYILYFVIMFNSMRIFMICSKIYDFATKPCRKKDVEVFTTADSKPVEEGNEKGDLANRVSVTEKIAEKDDEEDEPRTSIFTFPKERSVLYKVWWVLTWPLKLVLGITIPSPVTCRKFYPLAFLMCIIWIGVNSYFVSWSMTVIGHTFFIPESVMGMTFLAFGGCLPEACSIFIMSRRGKGGIGVSNALGANSLAILFALGLPWLIKTLTLLVEGADSSAVHINSAGIDFVVGSLLVAVTCLWIVLFLSRFTLRRSMGFVLAVAYLIFITFAILVEMGIILDRAIEGF